MAFSTPSIEDGTVTRELAGVQQNVIQQSITVLQSNRDDACLMVADFNNFMKQLKAAERPDIFLEASGNFWKFVCTGLKKRAEQGTCGRCMWDRVTTSSSHTLKIVFHKKGKAGSDRFCLRRKRQNSFQTKVFLLNDFVTHKYFTSTLFFWQCYIICLSVFF